MSKPNKIHNKEIEAINADSSSKRLKITFKDGSLGQLTFKQIEQFYGMFYLPDMVMQMKLPELPKGEMLGKLINKNAEQNKKDWVNGVSTFQEAVQNSREFQSEIIMSVYGSNKFNNLSN